VLYDALYLIIPSPILYSLILIQTQWVLAQYRKQQKLQKKKTMDDIAVNEQFGPDNGLIVSLQDIMADFEGYKAFMEYLVKCVSAENLLFVSEALQFMKDLTKKYNVKASSVQLQTYHDQYNVPRILPKSAIITEIEATSVRFLRLCEKYILVGSEFEINISGKHRKNLIQIYKLLEDKINSVHPKINKLTSIFGNDSELTASRRASQAKYLQNKEQQDVFESIKRQMSEGQNGDEYEDEDEDENKEDFVQKKKKNKQKNESQKSKKISHIHSCVEDFQLLSNTDDIIQRMYDSLCYTLGDVHTNLNDGCGRFMQTKVYYRWFQNNFKKEQVLQDEEEPSSSDSGGKKNERTDNIILKKISVPSHTQTNDRMASSDEYTPNSTDNETKPINRLSSRFSTAL